MHLEIEDVEHVAVASITRRAHMDRMSEAISEGFGTVMAALEQAGVQPAGPPLTEYPEPIVDDQPVMVIVAVPVPPGVDALDGVDLQILPGGRVAVATHVGSYEGLGATYQAIMGALADQHLQVVGGPREIYLNDPDDTPEAELITRIEFPIAG